MVLLKNIKKTDTDISAEYFSEGYREYFEDPQWLKDHDPDLYQFISEEVQS